MAVLVVGGAGYIGSHTVRGLLQSGQEVWVLDNLSQGHPEAVPAGKLLSGDLLDRSSLEAALQQPGIDAVMHFAAFAIVPESVADPAKYYQNNLVGTLNLLDAMRTTGVKRLVFSSTAAVYGVPDTIPIPEDAPKAPINPYGFTKLAMERALADYAHAYGIGYTVLRYFNACGAASDGSIGEDHNPETHLIPITLQVALGQRESLAIFGTDYPTADGTCIRDYIHVEDLADAHIRAIARIVPGEGQAYNVGTGVGFSVRQVVESARRITGRPIAVVEKPRRPGDPPSLVAAADKIRRDLGWSPRYTDIDAIIKSAWAWHEARPLGYRTQS
jgi:UDP-glucose 4-epimerase